MTAVRPPKVPKKVIKPFSPEQIQRLLAVPDRSSTRGFRQYMIMLVFLDTGIRLSEFINLTIEQVDTSQSHFRILGKGNKERIVPFGSQVSKTLLKYITKYRPEPVTPRVNQLLLSESGFPMKKREIESIILRIGDRAGISNVRCSPHTFHGVAATFNAKDWENVGAKIWAPGPLNAAVTKLVLELLQVLRDKGTIDGYNPPGGPPPQFFSKLARTDFWEDMEKRYMR